MSRKILLIVEGEKEEIRILGSHSHGLLHLIGADYEIVPFANPIYELYDAYVNNEYDDLVAYLVAEKGLTLDKGVISKNAFSAIYLFFDFEPHYHKYSDDKIIHMSQLFNNETDLGKLYINYPMVESIYHFSELPDTNFNNRTVTIDKGFNGKEYKSLVNKESCIVKSKITPKEMCYIIAHNYYKARSISGCESNEVSSEEVLKKQIELKNHNKSIQVLSMMPLLVMDYNYEEAIHILQRKLKTDFHIIAESSV